MKEKATALGITENHISVIPMGVDSQYTFVPPATNTVREGLIFVGRLVDKKGIEYLIRALPQVLEKNPQQRLTVIGDGPLKESLLDLCSSISVEHAVSFAGSLPNQEIPAYLQKSAIAVIPSVVTASGDQEGAPVAIMETLACGCATIVSDYPGARDIIIDNHNGLLVSTNSSTQIAEKINYLLANPDAWRSLGEQGRDTIVNNFDWQVICASFQAVFDRVAQVQSKVEASDSD